MVRVPPVLDCRGRMSVGGYHLAKYWLSCGVALAECARRLRISPKAVRINLAGPPPNERPRRLPRPSFFARTLQRRRGVVKRLAMLTTRAGLRKFPSCAAISRALPDSMKVCTITVRRDLIAMGFVSRKRQRGPMQLFDDAAKRVAVCKVNLLLNPALPKFFSDEKIFDVNDRGYLAEWCLPGTLPSRRQRSRWCPSVHVSAVIGVGYRKLIVLPKGTIDAKKYVRLVLSKIVDDLQGGIFMQDGAPAHTAASTLRYLARKGVTLLLWSARSPDLNPIETLWAIVQRSVSLRGPRDRDELIKFVVDEWEKIPQSTIDALVTSYEARCKECVRRGGATV